MMIPIQLIFVLVAQGFMSCYADPPLEVLTVKVMEPLTLNCTYNCSIEFVRGCWRGKEIKTQCRVGPLDKSGFCTVSHNVSEVFTQTEKNFYECYTQRTDDPHLPRRIERMFLIVLPAQTTTTHLTSILTTESRNESLPMQPNNSAEGESTGIQVLATVSVFVAMILAALAVYLCVNRQHWNCKGEPLSSTPGSPQRQDGVLTPVKGTLSAQSERVTLRIPPPDNEDDTEVPYADIMITVRGVSTPELTQVNYTAVGDQKEWWGDDSRAHLQASRSADRLHVSQPREVSRKISTNSEYAIITYA